MLSFLSKGEGMSRPSPDHRLCRQLIGADEIVLAVIPILFLNLHIVQAGALLNRLVCSPDVSLHHTASPVNHLQKLAGFP